MDNTSLVILPVEKVREMIESAVSGCLDKALAALQPRQESESVDIEGALEFLNSNGYRIAKGNFIRRHLRETYPIINSGTGCISKYQNCGNGRRHGW